jgi:hypothetical protein
MTQELSADTRLRDAWIRLLEMWTTQQAGSNILIPTANITVSRGDTNVHVTVSPQSTGTIDISDPDLLILSYAVNYLSVIALPWRSITHMQYNVLPQAASDTKS